MKPYDAVEIGHRLINLFRQGQPMEAADSALYRIAAALPSILAEYALPPTEPTEAQINAGAAALDYHASSRINAVCLYHAMVRCHALAPGIPYDAPERVLTGADIEARELRKWAVDQAVRMGGNPDRLPQVAQTLVEFVMGEPEP